MNKLLRIIGLALCAVMLLTTTAILPVVSAQEDETVYFHKFTKELRADYGNPPDSVKYGTDGSLIMKSLNCSVQKQCYFNIDKAMAQNAVAQANKEGATGKLVVTVEVGDCVDETGADQPAEIKIWLDTTYGDEKGDVIIQEWQAPHTTVTYELDVSKIVPSSMKGFYVCAMNYKVKNGIAPTVTFSACTVKVEKDMSKYFHLFTEEQRRGYGNGPDKVVYFDDGAVMMKSIDCAKQRQMYFGFDGAMTKAALARAQGAEGSGKLYCTVRLDSCTNINGKPTYAHANLWIDNGTTSDYRNHQMVDSGQSVTLEIDVTKLTHSEIKGVYISVENYAAADGVASVATFSPVMTEPPVLGDYSTSDWQYVENEDKTITLTNYIGLDAVVNIPSEVDSKTVSALGEALFDYNTDITSVTLPESVKKISRHAFRNCIALESLTLANGLTEIEGWAFESCTKLKNIVIPDSVTKIGSGIFNKCTALTNVTLPKTLETLTSSMFYGCTALAELNVPKTLKSIKEMALGELEGTKISGYNGTPIRDYALQYGFEYVAINNGDANADKAVNAKDVLLIKQFLADWKVTPNVDFSDVNADNTVNAKDLLYIRQLLADIPVEKTITPFEKGLTELEKVRRLYTLSWADEFDGDKLDSDNWSYEGSKTHRNGELQSYCDTADEGNVYFEDGKMVIEGRHEDRNGYTYSSGSVHTRGKQQFLYGIMEIKAKLPKGKGVWPAFWMMGVDPYSGHAIWPQTGELDILELVGGGTDDRTAYGTIHATDEKFAHVSGGGNYVMESGTFNDAYHTFGVLWTENEVYWYVDDIIYFIHDNTDPNYACFNKYENYIIINLAIGGSWAGTPAATTEFPAKYILEYCRVYQNKTAE